MLQSADEVRQKAEGSVAKAESRAMALQQQLVLLQLRLQEQGQLIRESTHQESRLESQLQEVRMELKVTETREHELRALAAELEVSCMLHGHLCLLGLAMCICLTAVFLQWTAVRMICMPWMVTNHEHATLLPECWAYQ